eukprot:m.247927 g.247927  ORF g.247927 m.247927 type:complete len:148 (-) comp19071_c0_seq19:905-1348(-)
MRTAQTTKPKSVATLLRRVLLRALQLAQQPADSPPGSTFSPCTQVARDDNNLVVNGGSFSLPSQRGSAASRASCSVSTRTKGLRLPQNEWLAYFVLSRWVVGGFSWFQFLAVMHSEVSAVTEATRCTTDEGGAKGRKETGRKQECRA